ncbi:hypothetical protein M5K25_027707 [Dendrobium thyrsiflorum]|uniref:Uncharacterized protein n=1 Tax=Dendrobium thyrsiflorum TaxID=117978 RepID=A0ABD0TUJ3_DENTH
MGKNGDKPDQDPMVPSSREFVLESELKSLQSVCYGGGGLKLADWVRHSKGCGRRGWRQNSGLERKAGSRAHERSCVASRTDRQFRPGHRTRQAGFAIGGRWTEGFGVGGFAWLIWRKEERTVREGHSVWAARCCRVLQTNREAAEMKGAYSTQMTPNSLFDRKTSEEDRSSTFLTDWTVNYCSTTSWWLFGGIRTAIIAIGKMGTSWRQPGIEQISLLQSGNGRTERENRGARKQAPKDSTKTQTASPGSATQQRNPRAAGQETERAPGFSAIWEHKGSVHDRNSVVSFGGKPRDSDGPDHNHLPVLPFGGKITAAKPFSGRTDQQCRKHCAEFLLQEISALSQIVLTLSCLRNSPSPANT